MYINLCKIIGPGIPQKFVFLQFSQNIDGFRQKNSQSF